MSTSKQPSIRSIFKPVTESEYLSHSRLHAEHYAPSHPQSPAPTTSEEKKAKLRIRNKEEAQRSREKKKRKEIEAGLRDEHIGKRIIKQVATLPSEAIGTPPDSGSNVAKDSHSDGKRKKVNWFNELLWPLIDASALRNNFQLSGIIKDLQRRFHVEGYFDKLTKTTVQSWIDIHKKPRDWKDSVLEKIDNIVSTF
jgi:hypothetical protein